MIAVVARRLAAVWVALVLAGCARGPDLSPRTGYVQTDGGRLWYRIAGHGRGTPLLVLHGGPGASSYYLKPLDALGDDRPVIYYDQLGCGHSDPSPDTTRWTIEHYVREIDDVRQALGLRDVHLYGHSWGTIVATEYTLRHPHGLRSLTLSSPVLSVPRYIHGADSLRALLPDSTQQAITRHEKDGTTDAPEYQQAMAVFYSYFLARKQPWSADTDSTFATFNQAIYQYMQGPSEFTITGTLKDYDSTPRVKDIDTPTLVLAGKYDEVTTDLAAWYARLIPGARCIAIPEAAHLSMQDNAQSHNDALRAFLRQQDAARH